jgi:hypothetical protein
METWVIIFGLVLFIVHDVMESDSNIPTLSAGLSEIYCWCVEKFCLGSICMCLLFPGFKRMCIC